MAKKPLIGNYLKLEDVRISYDEKSDSVHLTSKDKDLPKGKGFHLTLNGGRAAELTLREMLEDFGMIAPVERPLLPKALNFDTDVIDSDNPHRIPLGRIHKNQELCWDLESNPHCTLIGGAGSGKSVTQRLLFLHCLKHPRDWSIRAIDLKRVELANYALDDRDLMIARSMKEAHELVLSIVEEMNLRYSILDRENVDTAYHHQKSIMFVIDEIGELVATREHTTELFNKLQKEAIDAVKEIINRGAQVGVYVAIGTQRADFLDNLDSDLVKDFLRISMGRTLPEDSFKIFDGNGASRVNQRIRGRGYYKDPITNEEGQVQVYFSMSP